MRLPGYCETREHETGVEGHEAGGGRGHEAGGESDIEAASSGRTILEGRGQPSSPPPRPLNQSASYRHGHVSAPPRIGTATYRHGKASRFLDARFLVQNTGGRLPVHGSHDT